MFTFVKTLFACYSRDVKGQFAVMTALFGLPLLLICGYAIDINQAVSKKTSLSSALDAAALAAVLPANLTDDERKEYARVVFAENYYDDAPVTLTIDADREHVRIVGASYIETIFSGLVGTKKVEVSEVAEAVLTRSDIICVLALDPAGDRALEFLEDSRFKSPACSVQANSNSELAMVSDLVVAPIAKTFCTSGISRGEYVPYVKHACTPVPDPYAGLTPPDDGPCLDVKKIKGVKSKGRGRDDDDEGDDGDDDDENNNGDHHHHHHANSKHSTRFDHGHGEHHGPSQDEGATEDEVGDNAVLIPGTYCNGLDINGINVTFPAGTYVITGGRFRVRAGAQAIGKDVIFIMKGKKAYLHIEGNSKLTLKAPSKGKYAGIALYHAPNVKYGKKVVSKVTHLITSGGGLSITGTVYFPASSLTISSDSPVVSQAPSTSFIAYRIKFTGRANVEVHVDHEAGGIPPTLPRSDEGARLIE